MRLSILLTSFFLGLTLLSGCGGGSSDDSGDGGSGGSGGSSSTDGGSDGNGESGNSPLVGTWKKLCGPVEESLYEDPWYDVQTATFTATKYDVDSKIYSGSDCLQADLLSHNPSAKGTYILGDAVTTSGGVTATKIDFQLTEVAGASVIEDVDPSIVYINGGSFYLGEDTEAGRPITLNYDRQYLHQ